MTTKFPEVKDKAKMWDALKETNVFDLSGMMLTQTEVELMLKQIELDDEADDFNDES